MAGFVDHGFGQMQRSDRTPKDIILNIGTHTEEPGMRFDSGLCCSYQSMADSMQSRTDSIRSIRDPVSSNGLFNEQPTSDTRLVSTDSALGSIDAPSLNQIKLQNLQIGETQEEPCEQPRLERKVITLAQLKARTKAQKIAYLASYDFNTTEEIPGKSKKRKENVTATQ